jgi:hypothetical protein
LLTSSGAVFILKPLLNAIVLSILVKEVGMHVSIITCTRLGLALVYVYSHKYKQYLNCKVNHSKKDAAQFASISFIT